MFTKYHINNKYILFVVWKVLIFFFFEQRLYLNVHRIPQSFKRVDRHIIIMSSHLDVCCPLRYADKWICQGRLSAKCQGRSKFKLDNYGIFFCEGLSRINVLIESHLADKKINVKIRVVFIRLSNENQSIGLSTRIDYTFRRIFFFSVHI